MSATDDTLWDEWGRPRMPHPRCPGCLERDEVGSSFDAVWCCRCGWRGLLTEVQERATAVPLRADEAGEPRPACATDDEIAELRAIVRDLAACDVISGEVIGERPARCDLCFDATAPAGDPGTDYYYQPSPVRRHKVWCPCARARAWLDRQERAR